jgi:hypothetical protein
VVEDDGEDEEVVVTGPGPGAPVGEVAVDEKEGAEEALEVERTAVHLPTLGQHLLAVIRKDMRDFVLVEPVVQLLLLDHLSILPLL